HPCRNRRGRGGAARSRAVVHAPVPALAARRGAGDDAGPARGLRQGAGDAMMLEAARTKNPAGTERPRLGFLGVGWIGRHRMRAIAESGAAEIAAIADPSAEMREAAAECAGDAELFADFDALLATKPDGVVIATPSALHAEQ